MFSTTSGLAHRLTQRLKATFMKTAKGGTKMEKRRMTILGLAILSVMTVAVLLWAAGSAGASPSMGPLKQGGAPLLLNYQGRLADPTTGLPKSDGAYNVTFKIYDADTDGPLIWSETQQVEVDRGLFNVLLGSSTALSASDFDGTSRWLELEIEGETLSPRVRIVSVPYAIQAEEAKNAWSLTGNSGTDPATNFLGTTDSQPLNVKTNGMEAMRIDTDGNVGIGTTEPSGKLNIKSSLNTVGTVFSLPAISQLPDPSYTHDAVMQWEGGETKFGKWRQYFNGYEQSWALTYNAPWDYTNNEWLGRDSGDSRANIAAYMRFNVAEGDSGENTFEVNFAKGAAAGVAPDWNDGAYYFFYEGRTAYPAKPATLLIRGAASMDAILELTSHETVNPLRIDLVSDGLNRRFKIRDKDSGTDFLAIDTTSGNVGIGTMTPQSAFQVVGNYIQFPTISGGPPSATDCDSMDEAGRMVVRTDGPPDLYVCTGTNWVGK